MKPRDPDKVCGARVQGGNGKCQNWKGYKTDHVGFGSCYRHCEGSPNCEKAAVKKLAKDAVIVYGLPVRMDPFTALLEEVHRTVGHVMWLQDKLYTLDEEKLAWNTVEMQLGQVEGLETAMQKQAAVPSVFWDLYQEERTKLVNVCKTAIACGLAKHQAELNEDTSRRIAQVLRGVLEDLGFDLQQPELRSSLRKHLKIAGGVRDVTQELVAEATAL